MSVQGDFFIEPRSAPPITHHSALAILLPTAPSIYFEPIANTAAAALADTLATRMHYATKMLRLFRTRPHNITQFYLGIYIDAHIPLYKQLGVAPGTTLADVYAMGLAPELQTPPSQISIKDYVTSTDIIARIPSSPIPRLLAKAVRITRNIKHGIQQRATDPACIKFVHECVNASILGNYYHSRFKSPRSLSSIQQRIAALARTDRVIEEAVDIALGEYISALLPIYPYTQQPDLTWPEFVQCARYAANKDIRGCASLDPPDRPHKPPIIQKLAPDSITTPAFTECLMPTGVRSTYLCPSCRAVSAYVVNKPHGFKKLKIALDPFEPHDTPEPTIVCSKCDIPALFIPLHGLYLCINSTTAITVCPLCNHLYASITPLQSTTCTLCVLETVDPHFCYHDNKPITSTVCVQYSINTRLKKVEALDSCEFHHYPGFICDRVRPSALYATKKRRRAQSSRKRDRE